MIGKILSNRIFWVFAVFIILGISFMGQSISDKNAMAKGVTDFNEMTELDFFEGRFVEGTVYDLLDEFAYEEEYRQTFGIKHGERISNHYYILPLEATYDTDNPQFMALCIGNTALAGQAQKMIDEYWDYLVTGEEPAVWTEIHITGKISKLDGELLDYFYDWFYEMDDEMTREDITPMICPYMITYRVENASDTTMTMSVGLLAVGIIGCAAMILWYKRQADGSRVDFGGNSNSFGNAGNSGSSNSFGNSGSFGNTNSPEFPTASAQGNTSGYNPVSGNAQTGSNAQSAQSEPPMRPGEYRDMDSIDTSGLGIGIGDDDN